jgi:hypothetical protein
LQLGLVTPGYQIFLAVAPKFFIYIEKTTNASVVRLDACSCYLCHFLQKRKTVNLCRYMPLKENKMISFSLIADPASASFPVRAGPNNIN